MSAIKPTQKSPSFAPVVNKEQWMTPTLVSNDPSQSASVSGSMIRIKGNGSNNGIVASRLSLSFDGQSVSVGISSGQTPAKTQALIAAALPPGYSVVNVPTFAPVDGALFMIMKQGGVDVGASFAAAQQKGSFAGQKVSKNELQRIVAELKKDGFSAAEKDELARAWAGTFNGAEWNSTKAAQKEYARLKEKFDLPVYMVR